MSIEEKNKAIIHRHVEEVFNQGDLSFVDRIIADDYVCHFTESIKFEGVEGFKQIVMAARNAFPDLHYTIEDVVAEGDKLAVCYTWTGTHQGVFLGIPATGKQITMKEAIFYHFQDGKEVEALPYVDMLAIYRQLGVSPPGN